MCKSWSTTTLTIIAFLFCCQMVADAGQNSAATVHIDLDTATAGIQTTRTASVGDVFDVDIVINGAVNLTMFGLVVTFPQDTLEVQTGTTDVTIGDFLGKDGAFTFLIPPDFDTPGKVGVTGIAMLEPDQDPDAQAADGDGVLVHLRFKVLSAEQADLQFLADDTQTLRDNTGTGSGSIDNPVALGHAYGASVNPIPLSVAFEVDSSSGDEAVSPATLSVILSKASAAIVTVDYSVTGGTAMGGGTDYTLAAGILTFSPGETTKNISLTLNDDSLDEADETVVVTLSNPANATLRTNTSHTYTIIDNEIPPSVEFSVDSSAGAEAVSPVTLKVELSAPSGRIITVNYSVTGGTATGGGVDYTLAADALTFSPGDTSRDITITIVNDSSGEANETIIVTLSNPVNAILGTNTSHTYTIENDDASSVEFSAASSSGPEADSPAILDVQLLPAIDKTVTVDYSVSLESTATGGGADYTLADGTLTFQPNQTDANIPIPIVNDSVQEPDETIVVTLSNSSANATIGTNGSHTYTIINDDDETDPNTYGHIPELNSEGVMRDTIIQMHIKDAMIASTSGVDANTVQIQVEGEVIYNSAAAEPNGTYNSAMGICRGVRTLDDDSDYIFVFQPSTLFDYEQKVDVTVNAADKAGNVMAEENYYFYTVMRSFGKNVKVNSDTGTLIQDRPATATDSSGNIWVVWDQTTPAGDTDIYIGKLEAGANTFRESTSIPTDTNNLNNQRNPAIAIDDSNNIYVAWEGDDPNGFLDIFVSTSTDGSNWSDPVRVNDGDPNNTRDQTSPAIAIDNGATPNTVYIVWEDDRAENKDIWLATSTDGTTWTPTRITDDLNNQTEPAIAIDTNNVAYVMWTDTRNTSKDIFGVSCDAGQWSNATAIISTENNQSSPAIATGPSGHVHILWIDDADPNTSVFYATTTDGIDGSWLIDPNVVDEPNYLQIAPAIAVKGSASTTKIFACWQDARYTAYGDDALIYFTESGSGFGTNIRVVDDAGVGSTQTAPVVGIDKNGNPYIVWVDNRSGNNDIYYARATAICECLATSKIVDANQVTIQASAVDGLQVTIPAGALPDGIGADDIEIAPVTCLPKLPTGGFGVCYNFGPSGLVFNVPVTISIPHDVNDCPGLLIYHVYCYDACTCNWCDEGISNVQHIEISPTLHAVTFQTNHFTTFGTGASSPVGGGGGGGGGCAMSPYGQSNATAFLLPYIVYVMVLLAISWVDARRRRKKCSSR